MSATVVAQVYLDEFDNDDPAFTGGAGTYSIAEMNGEMVVTGSGTGAWDVFTYQMHDPSAGAGVIVDATGNNKVYVRAKASNVGTQLRMDIQDAGGYMTTNAGLTKTLTTDYQVLEFDFTGVYQDGGYGGTACDAADAPCPVDGTMSNQLVFYADPGIGGFAGTIIIDYVAFGEEPSEVIMSDVFQDHFDMDSSINSIAYVGAGLGVDLDGSSNLVVTGDGTSGAYDPITYIFRNPVTLDTIDLDVSGNNKLYVKMKSSLANTALRIDLQDLDGFITTQGSITKILGTDYTVFEYDFTGTYQDLGYGGTPCTPETAPCPVDPTRIADILLYINPGSGEFLGEITIDYISFGIPLEPAGPEAQLIYGDHFGNATLEYVGDAPGFISSEAGTEWSIAGDGSAGAYAAISYILHDKTTGEDIFVDMGPAQNKVFVRARTDGGDVPLRLDLVDTLNFHTSQASLTKVIGADYNIYEFDFTGGYFDGGFGGTACDAGPCPVDATMIRQMLFYVDPVAGGFSGNVHIDFISIGQPLGEDLGPTGVIDYSDQMDDNTSLFLADMNGFTSTVTADEWTITGDGTAGAYTPVVYSMHNDLGETIIADAVGSGDKMYVHAKASVDGTELRIDVQDNQGYVSNLNAVANNLNTEYAIYEYNYVGSYQDGAYGGSPCEVQPCPVDGQRIENLQFFVNAADGGFAGDVTIDWISFGMPLETSINDITRLNELKAYPNPVLEQVYLQFDLVQSAEVRINLYNSIGQLVQSMNLGQQLIGSNTAEMNLRDLTNGIYFTTIEVNGVNSGTLKLIKN